MDEAPLPLIDDQHAASFDGTRSNKLARKAESARQARLRHKAYVTDLQEQVGALQARVRSLEPQCAPEQTAMHVVRELQSALSAEQHAQLTALEAKAADSPDGATTPAFFPQETQWLRFGNCSGAAAAARSDTAARVRAELIIECC